MKEAETQAAPEKPNKFQEFVNSIKMMKNYFIENTIQSYQKSKELGKTNYDLGIYHLYHGNTSDAIMRFKMLLMFHVYEAEAWFNLGRCYLAEEAFDKAEEAFNKALALKPDLPEATFFLASIDKKEIPPEVPLTLLQEFYNFQAPNYDDEMINQHAYVGDRILYQSIAPHLLDTSFPTILDIGCGTGLCGSYFKMECPQSIIDGVDISDPMLAIARLKTFNNELVYRNLTQDDFASYAATSEQQYDLIISGLSLGFKQDITPSLNTLKGCLKKGGHIAFTLPKTISKEVQKDQYFYVCKEDEVTKAMENAGFKVEGCKTLDLTNNQKGVLCYGKKASEAT